LLGYDAFMGRSFQYRLRHLFIATAVIAALVGLGTDMVHRLVSHQADTVWFALEGNALAAAVVILMEWAWLRRYD
jgi:hypothetical protein